MKMKFRRTFFGEMLARFFKLIQQIVDKGIPRENIYLLAPQINEDRLAKLHQQLDFYTPGYSLISRKRLSLSLFLSSRPILLFGASKSMQRLHAYRGGVFDIDDLHNPMAASKLCWLADHYGSANINAKEVQERFTTVINDLKEQNLQKAYVFGTGPSLGTAIERDWSDGYRIVCNTIVRDAELWQHLNPHFIVAGDALYHFSYTQFAHTFRTDLAKRLAETETYFAYPQQFHAIVMRELGEFSERLFPVPVGAHKNIAVDLTSTFALPRLGNVLSWLLLPVGCTLSQDIGMWGFDGRAPDDQLFWANSSKHSYPELMPELQQKFPAFFHHYVPEGKEVEYVKRVHGDRLDIALTAAEAAGWRFRMLHKSWTPTLQKRYSIKNT